MLLPLLPLRAVTLALTGWFSTAPGPVGDAARAEIQAAASAEAALPVTVELYDVNHNEFATITLNRDGTADKKTTAVVERLLRCKRTDRHHRINRKTLAMFATVAATWPGRTIEVVSGYRAMRSESRTSPHRAARAIDFRIQGISTKLVRDTIWREFRAVGIGWYPEGNYVHIDSRPGEHDTAWTFVHGKNRYHPSWAERIRPAFEEPPATPGKQHGRKPHRTHKPLRRYHGAGV